MTDPQVCPQNNNLNTDRRNPETNPVIELLALLYLEGNRKNYLRHLNKVADIASGGEQDAPVSANLMLSALRRVLYYTRKFKLKNTNAVDFKNDVLPTGTAWI